MRILKPHLAVTLLLSGGMQAALAQSVENGERLSQRWCSECHAIGPTSDKIYKAPSFAVIAAKNAIDADMVASFLLLPHATMPNLPLTRKDARDIALFIVDMKK